MKKKFCILFVAMSESIHTARWISQISNQSWDIHLFPSIDYGIVQNNLENITVHHSIYGKQNGNHKVNFSGFPVISGRLAALGRRILKKVLPEYRVFQLKRLIKTLKPDIIHSMEFQAAGYLVMNVKRKIFDNFPKWIATPWGSDIYLFGKLAAHETKVREILSNCDYYQCESQRDIDLARFYGLKGKILPILPATGSFDIQLIKQFRQPGLVSERRFIMLKGYQGWSGRALVGLRALERCADLLNGYKIIIYSPTPEVLISAELFTKSTGIPIDIISHDLLSRKVQDMLKLHGQSRISIGLGISDGLSSSFLEALVMGSFPIQSWTSTSDEWIEDGKTGILVPPEDPDVIELAIRRALTDDNLVNKAAEINYRTAEERLEKSILQSKAIQLYKSILEDVT